MILHKLMKRSAFFFFILNFIFIAMIIIDSLSFIYNHSDQVIYTFF